MEEQLKELPQFLSHARVDLKAVTLEYVVGLTATAEGRELLLMLPEALQQLVTLMQDTSASISKDAALALINITGDELGTNAMLIIAESKNSTQEQEYSLDLIQVCINAIMDKSSTLADHCCMILSNMTRPIRFLDKVIKHIELSDYSWDAIIAAFTAKQYNTTDAKLHYLGPVFSNLTQSPYIRCCLMDRDRCIIQQLLPFTEYSDSAIRRAGIVGVLKNCAFDTQDHEWLLSPKVDLLSYLLLPLAGPEEFDEEDNDKLLTNLQYLPETKTREPEPHIRLMLLEALNQLCATRAAREILRGKNTYVILRELHNWETDQSCLLACENVVDILIKTEEEICIDNLKKIEVPSEYIEKFDKMNMDNTEP